MLPIIGITPAYDSENGRLFLRPPYLEAVLDAGGLPVILPLAAGETHIRLLLGMLHGLVLSGGGDLDPAFFHEPPNPRLGEVQPLRDLLELKLTRLALEENLPLLGICRGIQVMNVAAGGSLIQDLPSQRPGGIRHRQTKDRNLTTHRVEVKERSHLGKIVKPFLSEAQNKGMVIEVNSLHHQAVKDLGAGFSASAWSRDGIIEAIEALDRDFAVGVQWHPEDLYKSEKTSRALFTALIEAAGRRMAGRG